MRELLHRSSIWQDEHGSIATLWAITLPVIAGFVGLALDTGTWYAHQRSLQSAADAAAVATGYEINSGNGYSLQAVAQHEAQKNGAGSSNGVTVTTQYPPSSGSYNGNNSAVEITLRKTEQRFFSRFMLNTDPTVVARAVAIHHSNGSACVLALDTSANDALDFQGNPTVNLNGCIAASNSSATDSINIWGSATLTAQNNHTMGNYALGGAGNLTTTDTPITYGAAITDPYADLADPSFSGCSGGSNVKLKNTVTINPGVFCGGLTVNANANVTMNPGTYYINGDQLKINGGATINGTGVTIVLTGSGSDYATIDVNGTATLNLSSPTSGTYEGLVMYQDRNAPTSGINKLNGNSSTSLNGAVYFPSQELEFTGGNSTSSSVCTQLIARTIKFGGNAGLANNCSGNTQSEIDVAGNVQLVE